MKNFFKWLSIQAGLTIILFVFGLIIVEGVRSLASGDKVQMSATAGFLSRWKSENQAPNHRGPKTIDDLNERSVRYFADRYIVDEALLRKLLPDLNAAHVMLGATPFMSQATPENRVTLDDPKLGLVLKPNLDIELGQLRKMLYHPLDPIAYYMPTQSKDKAPPLVRNFLDKYRISASRFTTDKLGHRNTVPTVEAKNVILVCGDSVAFGAGVNDDQTLASRLQQMDSTVRYINMGVPNSTARENRNRLHVELNRSEWNVVGIIYVHCENDFENRTTPFQIVTPLADAVDAADLKYRVFVYQQYLGHAQPDLFRLPDEGGYYPKKDETIELARQRGFQIVDGGKMVQDFCDENHNLFVGPSLYIDHCHYSDLGLRRLTSLIPPHPEVSAPNQAVTPPEP